MTEISTTSQELKDVLETLDVEQEVIQIFIQECITLEDLKTIKKCELDMILQKYGQRRRFGRILVKWLIAHNFAIDPELIMVYGDVQPAHVYKEDNNEQYFPVNNNTEIVNESFDLISSAAVDVDITSNKNKKSLPRLSPFSLKFQDASSSEKITIGRRNIVHPVENKVTDVSDKDDVQSEANDGHTNIEGDKFIDLVHVSSASVSISKPTRPEQQEIQPTSVNTDSEQRNPLFIVLQENGHRCCELVNDIQRKNIVLVDRDINLIGRYTAKHLLNLADPPKRKILTSTLVKWATYFQRLFPQTPISCFYAFKYEPYKRTDGIVVQKKRADGALQTQLFQERRKLIRENPDVLLRCPLKNSADDRNKSSSYATFSLKHTWRPVIRQEGENIPPPYTVPSNDIEPAIKWHIEYLQQLQDKLTLELLTSWKATFTYRKKQLVDQPGTVWDYLQEFSFLRIQDIGKALICQDFNQICSGADPTTEKSGKLVENLDKCRVAIIKTAATVVQRASQQKQKDTAALFFRLAESNNEIY